MPERPRPVAELTLDRDVGVYAYSDHLLGDRSPVAYRVGVFGGKGTGQTQPHAPGGLVVARVELRPLGDVDDDSEGDLDRRPTPGLAIGIAGAANVGTNRQRSTTGATYPDGVATYLHGAADLVFKWRGVSMIAEAVARDATADVVTAGDGRVSRTRSGWGWFAQPACMVTPRVEAAARYSELHAFDGTDPSLAPAREIGAGANLYLNGHRFKAQLGWTALCEGDATRAHHTMNLQLDTSF